MVIRRIGLIGRTYRHIQRYSEILTVLLKFGFEDLVINLKVEQYLDIGRQIFFTSKKEKIDALSRAVRLRMVFEELGPTFIKLGQLLSTRADFLPPEYIEELTRLQDEVPAFDYKEVERILISELGGPCTDVFASIDEKPLAAASIGQVHKAVLRDGETVVFKVRRPGIRRIIEVDLEILYHIATLMEKHLDGWDLHKPTEVVEEFGRTLERELDYRIEAANMERFGGQFQKEERVYVPKVFREATTEKVLTMEYVEGVKPRSAEALRAAGFDPREIADRGADLILIQVLEEGFFHADPHPGNLVILPGHIICYLDMGMMGRLDRTSRELILDLVMAMVRKDSPSAVDALLKLTHWEDEPDRRALEREVGEFLDQHFYRPLKELELGGLMQQLFNMAVEHRVRIPADLLLLLKALSAMEGLGRMLDPDFDVIAKAAPFVKKAQMARYDPRRLAGDLWDFGAEAVSLIREVPRELRTVLRLARQGRLKIEFEHKGLDDMQNSLERASNRMAFAIVLAALIIGSSLVIQSGIPPKWHDISIIGLAGYLVAGVMGFWLLISILRRGRM